MSDETRLRIDRARRAELAYNEFVKPVLERMDAAYSERAKEIVIREPWETDKHRCLMQAQALLDMLSGHLKAEILDGEMAKADLIKIETVSSMTHARRRALGV